MKKIKMKIRRKMEGYHVLHL